jgi:carbon monoxide dehydrogenase subunit G
MLSPDALRGCIPGCESFEETGEGAYAVEMKVGIGAIRGKYRATVTISEVVSPSSFRMAVSGKGSAGTIKGDGTVQLSDDDGATLVEVDGEAQVSGVIARVGQRLMGAAAKSLLGRFFDCMSKRVEGA